ncbi:MAG: DNA-binding protein [Thermomicrobiales bacterium]
MTSEKSPLTEHFPKGMSQPALRALEEVGFVRLEDAAGASKRELLRLHGFGPKSIPLLDDGLRERKLPPLRP